MANYKAVSFQAQPEGGTWQFQGVSPDQVAADVGVFFAQQRYRLEDGTPTGGMYGTGSALLRVLFGAFARRYKFMVNIQTQGNAVTLQLGKGMSGAMGGAIGYSKMKKETARLVAALQQLFS